MMITLYEKVFKSDAEREVQSPLEFNYVKIIRFALKIVNSWPSLGEESKYKTRILSVFLSIFIFSQDIGGALYILFHGKYLAFMEIGYAYLIMLMNVVMTSRLLSLTFSKKYRNVAKIFLTKIHLFYFKNNSQYAMKIHKQIHNISHSYTIYLAMQTFAALIFFCVMPLYNCYSSSCYKNIVTEDLTYEISVYINYPFHTYSNVTEYMVIFLCNCIYAALSATGFCMFDLFLSIMVFHVYGHFKVMLYELKTFPRPSQRLYALNLSGNEYSNAELQNITYMLKEWIEYHKMIVSFTKQMSDAFGSMLFVYYTFHQVAGCVLLLECSQMTTEALVRYLPMTLILFQQLMQLSIVFELIGSTSEKLKDAVYDLPWEYFDQKNKKTVLMLLMNVQEPIHVKALGIANVGVTTMAAILKTSLSYFTFLSSR